MITTMKYISITGHIGDMNHVVRRYLSRYDIQLEQNAISGLTQPFTTLNPYAATLKKAEFFAEIVGQVPVLHMPMTASDAVNIVEEAAQLYENRDSNLRALETTLVETTTRIQSMGNFVGLDLDLGELDGFQFTHYQFGRMSIANYRQYVKFLAQDARVCFVLSRQDESFVWGVYFTPVVHKGEMDTIFASLGFEVVQMEKEPGTPAQRVRLWQEKSRTIKDEISALTRQTLAETIPPVRLAIACCKVKNLYSAFDVKRFASLSKNRRIFTFSGWISAGDARVLEEEIAHDDLAVFTFHSFEADEKSSPPTLLKNPPIVRQFEFFTRLYGLPQYDEVDPTPLLAVTYTLLFGLMFGDVGHGFVLGLLGLFIRHKWKTPVGAIMAVVGASAMIFGFMYGSIFGFEDILPALWIRPAADITQTLIFAAGLGVGLIAVAMFIYMYNAFKQRRFADLLFASNGAAGFTFYAAMLWLGVRVMVFGRAVTPMVGAVVALPLLFVAFKHPLERFMAGGSSAVLENGGGVKSLGQFVFSTAIEMFETLLAYATNTISFVRVGAFAIIHAGMMHVVLQLSQGTAGMNSLFIIIAGNVLVMGIEGLLVGIQVLRLDFYEIFSRFYTGGGRVFTSNKIGMGQ